MMLEEEEAEEEETPSSAVPSSSPGCPVCSSLSDFLAEPKGRRDS